MKRIWRRHRGVLVAALVLAALGLAAALFFLARMEQRPLRDRAHGDGDT